MPRILIVEDDEDLRNLLEQLLLRMGYQVALADNGRSALLQMSKQPVDLVVTDMLMPEMEGAETILAVRQHYPDVKILAISGGGISSATTYLKIADALGAHKILNKPFEPPEFLKTVREVLGQE